MREKLINYVDRWFFIISPVMVVLTTGAGSFLTFSISPEFAKNHPVRFVIFEFFLDLLPFLFPILLVIMFLLNVLRHFSEKTIQKLLKEKQNIEVRLRELSGQYEGLPIIILDAFEGFLSSFGIDKLKFGAGDYNVERVTLYIYDDAIQGGECFIPFGRYSPNPQYKSKGRTSYPSGEGCIGKCWAHGWCFDNGFSEDKSLRHQKHLEYQLPKKTINALKMPSRLYAAMRIDDLRGRPIAVMVIESTDAERWGEAALKEAMTAEMKYLAEFIVRFQSFIPKPSSANSKGL